MKLSQGLYFLWPLAIVFSTNLQSSLLENPTYIEEIGTGEGPTFKIKGKISSPLENNKPAEESFKLSTFENINKTAILETGVPNMEYIEKTTKKNEPIDTANKELNFMEQKENSPTFENVNKPVIDNTEVANRGLTEKPVIKEESKYTSTKIVQTMSQNEEKSFISTFKTINKPAIYNTELASKGIIERPVIKEGPKELLQTMEPKEKKAFISISDYINKPTIYNPELASKALIERPVIKEEPKDTTNKLLQTMEPKEKKAFISTSDYINKPTIYNTELASKGLIERPVINEESKDTTNKLLQTMEPKEKKAVISTSEYINKPAISNTEVVNKENTVKSAKTDEPTATTNKELNFMEQKENSPTFENVNKPVIYNTEVANKGLTEKPVIEEEPKYTSKKILQTMDPKEEESFISRFKNINKHSIYNSEIANKGLMDRPVIKEEPKDTTKKLLQTMPFSSTFENINKPAIYNTELANKGLIEKPVIKEEPKDTSKKLVQTVDRKEKNSINSTLENNEKPIIIKKEVGNIGLSENPVIKEEPKDTSKRILQYMDRYCNQTKCGKNHIGCKNTGEYGPACPPDTASVDFSDFKGYILKLHNVERDRVAGGYVYPLKPAKQMAEMQWDEELQLMAQLNVNLCTTNLNECHSLERYPDSSQSSGTGPCDKNVKKSNVIKDEIQERFRKWISTSRGMSSKTVKHFTHSFRDPYAWIIAEDNTHVGCAAVTYEENEQHFFRMTCNYATSIPENEPIYSWNERPASNCTYGKSTKYQYLCKTQFE